MRDRPPPVPLGYRFVAGCVAAMAAVLRWRVDLRGADRLPEVGGAVVTWNHTSHLDFAITVVPLLRRTGRWVRFLALRQLWGSRTLGWVPRLAHCVPVDRESREGRDEALRDAITAAREGHLVMVAPEGTISESFELLPFRTGAVRIAQAAGVPIVPTVSWGTHRFVTTGHPFSVTRGWRLPVLVEIGEPFHVGPDEDPVAATERLRGVVREMLADVRARYPDGTPAGEWWVPAALGGGAPTEAEVLARHRPGQALNPGRFADRDDPHRRGA